MEIISTNKKSIITELYIHCIGLNNAGSCEMMAEVSIDGTERSFFTIILLDREQLSRLIEFSGENGQGIAKDIKTKLRFEKSADSIHVWYGHEEKILLRAEITALEIHCCLSASNLSRVFIVEDVKKIEKTMQ